MTSPKPTTLASNSNAPTGARLAVINEKMMRECIYLPGHVHPGTTSNEDRSAATFGKKNDRRGAANATAAEKKGERVELYEVECLMFSFKSIGQISNLVGVERLTKLHLDNNYISKIENLDHLVNLQWLDLSFNRIREIEGLDKLVHLENLSLFSNEIAVVKNLEALKGTLTCLSLGKNRIENLDEVAHYLHDFQKLRMVTLQGNKVIEGHNQYRARVISYVPNIKFFDNRLVSQEEILKAQEADENVRLVKEQDEKNEQISEEARKKETEARTYELANCPDEKSFFSEIFFITGESTFPIGKLISENETLKEQTKETVEKFKDDFNQKLKELCDAMKALKDRKDADDNEFHETYRTAKSRSDDECKGLIHAFEKHLKVLIPFGHKPKIDPDAFSEQAVSNLREQLRTLQETLMENEADQFDAYESLIEAYHKVLQEFKSEAVETLSHYFDEFRTLKKTFQSDLKAKLDGWSDERKKEAENADAGYGSGASSDRGGALKIFDNKEEYGKILTEWGEAQHKRLEDSETHFKQQEEERLTTKHNAVDSSEHSRNRSRMCEINDYCNRIENQISEAETSAFE